MQKEFNITGICYPDQHYMMDNREQLKNIKVLIERGKYFTINRPRQYGKTTTLHFLAKAFNELPNYLAIELNFQGVDTIWHESDKAFAQMFITQLSDFFEFSEPTLMSFFEKEKEMIKDMGSLSKFITRLIRRINKKIVLIIDEVDASSNYDAFLSFLGMLRTKYLARHKAQHATFHSIVLAGVHDIKTLKYKKNKGENTEYNSPWNIATDFSVVMRFNPTEITFMLTQYSDAEGVEIGLPIIAERLYYYTSGYPFLVSKLCKIIAETILPQSGKTTWTLVEVERAVQLLLKENNTNFDSLIKNLENNQDLYHLVKQLLIDGAVIPFNQHNPTIHLGVLYGVFKANGRLKIHNRLYEQLIYNYMTSKALTNIRPRYILGQHFLLPDNALDMRAVLLKFQQFMKEQYSEKDKDFYEREGRTIFLAFLAPILNGQGYTFKEVQTSLEKRLDIIVTYFQHRYIIELKLWYGQKYHQEGLSQLADYLTIHDVDKGFLLVFDDRKKKSWKVEDVTHEGKDIFGVWV